MFSATLHSTADIRILKWEKIGIYERERERERERGSNKRDLKKKKKKYGVLLKIFSVQNDEHKVLKYTISYREEPKEFWKSKTELQDV